MARYLAWVLLCAHQLAAGDASLRVNEAASKVVLRDGESVVSLAVENGIGAPLAARVRLEWLKPSGEADAVLERTETLAAGASRIGLAFPLPKGEPMWRRLRYRIQTGGVETAGVLALAGIAEHAFELHISASRPVRAGGMVRIAVFAKHPVSRRGVPGVRLRGRLYAQKESPLRAKAETGRDGLATLEFHLPDRLAQDELDLDVRGSLGDFRQRASAQLHADRDAHIRITTDKPLYQPGQALHVRALCFTPAGRAAPGLPLTLRIKDPEETAVFITRLKTSRFGVAAADWQIPENVRLGDYRIGVKPEDENDESVSGEGARVVKISRYDLPEFTVNVQPDRRYYLPGQAASVEVRAEYLFGKPVPRGHVRLVRESRREWNFRLQKWEIQEAESYEGEADNAGRSIVPVKLAKAQEELAARDAGPFEDLSFTAYYRDPLSGRTEERRFFLRISREPIHVYLIRGFSVHYVSTSYADGAPAACRVRVKGGTDVTTNRYGVARISLPAGEDRVELTADDGKGAMGQLAGSFYESSQELQVSTGKTLYGPGEPIHVEVATTAPLPAVAFAVMRGGVTLHSEWLILRDGRARVDLPWRKEFTREITFAASSGPHFGSRTVLYPAATELQIGLRPNRPVYRPGEEAAASIEVRLPDGRPAESVLGVSVVDAAVGERARADRVDRFDTGTDELGGLTRAELYGLDCAKPFPEDLDLLAEVMLAGDGAGVETGESADFEGGLAQAFGAAFRTQFQPLVAALDARYKKGYEHPRDMASLKRAASEAGLDVDSLLDPWGTPYRAVFSVVDRWDYLRVLSAGPDKKFGTGDDVVSLEVRRAWFQPAGDAIRRALDALPAYPQSEADARAALVAAHIDPDQVLDPWGTACKLELGIGRNHAWIQWRSAGPDRRFGTKDDVVVETISGSYFTHTERRLEGVLRTAKTFPQNQRDWNRLLRSAGMFPLRDPWGTPIYAVFQRRSDYSDLRKLYTAAQYGSAPQERTLIVPATLRLEEIRLCSAGPDGIAGNDDDFQLASLTRTYKTEIAGSRAAKPRHPALPPEKAGTIKGRVTDPTGAAVAGATVLASHIGADGKSEADYMTQSGPDGTYQLTGLLPGAYDVRAEAPGFQMYLLIRVPVSARRATAVDVTLLLGAVAEMVTVAAESLPMTAQFSLIRNDRSAPRSTPRLREYFPETLYWQPSLETGADGRAQLKFKLADNITTWKMEILGSTEDGQTGTAAADLRAFQPFFVDHNPPRVLTRGDEIRLPVTVRNYLDHPQDVSLSMKPENWFDLPGGDRKSVAVGASESRNAVFPLRAVTSVTDGKQRVTATSAAAGDAIEKPVTVHPDGMEITESRSELLRDTAALALRIPQNAIAGSARAELKIYPGLIAHVLDSIDGIRQRPYGCAEQIISSAYPDIMLLRCVKRLGGGHADLEAQALRDLRAGVDRLLGSRAPDGGFAYWGNDKADPALSAYALAFLTDAAEFVPVDEKLADATRKWLLLQQHEDGTWPAYAWKGAIDQRRTAYQTSLITLALADLQPAEGVIRALAYLAARAAELDEPYMIAASALALQKAGERAKSEEALERLRRLARSEAGLSYWNLESNTPFYGWGLAGRLETTAMAVRALAGAARESDRSLIDSALLFLLRNKDRYGVWHSTQATVRVLDAILAVSAGAAETGGSGPAEVLINGRVAETVTLPPADELAGPLRVDLSKYLATGENQVAVRRPMAGSQAQVQLVASYYVPWQKKPAAAGPLRLKVAFDRTAMQPGAAVTCRVDVERIGFRGYGMLLAEIGLPPGADVDRRTLDEAVRTSGWAFGHYDVLPDRLIAYLWPQAGGTHFSFRFRPRFAMHAKSAPSLLYDYYNPEARVTEPPIVFRVDESR